MRQTIFRGIATALATPMSLDGAIDYDAYGRLIDWQIESGVAALVACGTTGESATMTEAEHRQVISYTVRRAAGRVPVIVGTGGNCTAKAVAMAQFAGEAGADACLCVTPYYNKATQPGLVAHFTAIAEQSRLPIILYNVPSRTGCNLLPETCRILAEHPNIAAVKEASGNISQVVELAALTRGKLDLYSGNDDQIAPLLAMGGQGCISVLSNVAPKEAVALCDRFFAGDVAGAAELQCRLLPLIQALFCQVNPIPVKAALTALGFGAGGIRLPLTPLEPDCRQRLLQELRVWRADL